MVLENKGSILKDILKSLCSNNGWSYAVFWSFNQQNSLLLTYKDAYYEDEIRGLIDDMFLQVHVLGEGVIGRAALTLKHQFIFSDANNNKQNSIGSTELFEVYQDNFEFFSQFLGGIKTILVIPMEEVGVVQFGSFRKLPDTIKFVEQTKALFSEMGNGGLIAGEDMILPSTSEILSPSDMFASLLSSDNSWSASCGYLHGPGVEKPLEASLPLTNIIWPFPSTSLDEGIDDRDNQFNFDFCISNNQPQQSILPSSSAVNNEVDFASSLLSSADYAQTSLLQPFPSQTGSTDSHATIIGKEGGFHFAENFQDSTNSLFCPTDWFNNMESDHMLYLNSLSSSSEGYTKKVSEYNPSPSIQSSISNVFTTVENNKSSAMSDLQGLLDYSGEDSGCRSTDLRNFVKRGGHVNNRGVGPKCISRPTNKLFSSLGINHTLDDVSSSSCSVAKSSIEDQLSSANKRRRIGTPLPKGSADRLSSLTLPGGKMNMINSIYNPSTMSNVGSTRDVIHRVSDSLICDSFSIHGGKVSQQKQSEQPAKNPKKKSKPGIRPRPKDRQQIHDRLIELRKLIPNAEKMSIDCLLHRTIKHLLFLQSVSEHAESIKQLTNPKDKTVPPDISGTCDSGVTWACEVGDQTMVCPLIVEDLNSLGQMSIEIQCEEQGSFLEIVDIIRGFGLAILKGVMEAQEAKMSARFIVASEEKSHVTRHEIFSSLVQLLQFTNSSGFSQSDQFISAASGGVAGVGLFKTS